VQDHPWSVIGFGLVLGLFLLPIAIHTAVHYPGEFGKYLAYARSNRAGGHPLSKAADFFLSCLGVQLEHPRTCILGVGVLFLASLPWMLDRKPWRMIACMAGMGLLTSATFAYYILRGVDDLHFTYVGIFFGSVLVLGLAVGAMNLSRALEGHRLLRHGAIGLLGLLVAYIAWTGQFYNSYPGCPFVARSVERLRQHPRWGEDTVVLMVEQPRMWPELAGLIVALEREGKHVCVHQPKCAFLFTERFAITPQEFVSLGEVWTLDLAEPGPGSEPVLASTRETALLGDTVLRELPHRSQ
jgi:hypothetical protein